MDFATLIGLIGALSAVCITIFSGGSPGLFLSLHPFMIVIFGGFMVVLMKFSMSQFLGALRVAARAFGVPMVSPELIIQETLELSKVSRKRGLLALEDVRVSNPFMQKGVDHIVAGLDVDTVRAALQKELHTTLERHEVGQKIFRALADIGPAMGMVGTLIGLIQMFTTMDDPRNIGPGMALALLATLYGALLANVFALPIADKLELRSKEEWHLKSMIIDALVCVQLGQNPKIIEQLMRAYLPPDVESSGTTTQSGMSS